MVCMDALAHTSAHCRIETETLLGGIMRTLEVRHDAAPILAPFNHIYVAMG